MNSALHVTDGVAWIALERPDRGNALSAPMVESLIAHFDRACNESGVHTVVFAASGRHFCTGFDLSDLDTSDDAQLLQRFVRIELFLDAVWRAPVRTVAFAQGRCWGAGADLFAACDIRAAAQDASFRFPGAGFGIVLGSRRLAARCGVDQARALITTGAALTATAARDAGLVTSLVASISGHAPGAVSAEQLRQLEPAPNLDRLTTASVREATALTAGSDASTLANADLAALVRSAARPGLHRRLTAYRDRMRAAAR